MAKKRVFLLSTTDLLGESIQYTLQGIDDLEVDGPWVIDDQALDRLANGCPDLVIIAEGQQQSDADPTLTTKILETYPDLPIFRITLHETLLRMYSSHTTHASSAELIEIIRKLPVHWPGESEQDR